MKRLAKLLGSDAPLVGAIPALLKTLPAVQPIEPCDEPERLTWENYLDGIPPLGDDSIALSGINEDVSEDLATPEPTVSAEDEQHLSRAVARRAMLIRVRKLRVIRGG